MDLSKERVITAFVDGDRGGELILRELFQVAEVDFVARAPRGMEVEELTQKQIMKCLRNKIPGEQFMEMYGMSTENGKPVAEPREERAPKEQPRGEQQREREFREPREEVPVEQRSQERAQERPSERTQERPQERPQEKPSERPHREPRDRKERREPRESREPKEPREPVKELPVVEPVAALPEKSVEQSYEPEPVEIEPTKKLSEAQVRYKAIINDLSATSKARIMDTAGEVIKEVPVRELVNTLKANGKGVSAVVFDGIITQRILDIAADNKITTIVGTKMGNITKQPAAVEIWTKEDLNE